MRLSLSKESSREIGEMAGGKWADQRREIGRNKFENMWRMKWGNEVAGWNVFQTYEGRRGGVERGAQPETWVRYRKAEVSHHMQVWRRQIEVTWYILKQHEILALYWKCRLTEKIHNKKGFVFRIMKGFIFTVTYNTKQLPRLTIKFNFNLKY